jgi:hypothetical protein
MVGLGHVILLIRHLGLLLSVTQVLPTLDSEVLKVWQEAEEAFYAQ